MATPPSRKGSLTQDPQQDQASPPPGGTTKRGSICQSELSFAGSDNYQMSLLTSKLADKEKRVEEYKEQITLINSSYEGLKTQITVE